MITGNNKRIEFENLQDAMRIAKALLKNGYQVYMNIEDEIGDGKIIVIIEYEWVDEDLADGHYIYQTFEDEARIEAEIRQKKSKETNEDYIWGHEEGYQAGWTAGYNARLGEETPDDADKDEDADRQKKVDKESEDYLAGHAEGFQAGWTCGYERRIDEENADDGYDRDNNGVYNEGYEDGYSNGYEEGYDEGYETGLNEGEIDGCRNDE